MGANRTLMACLYTARITADARHRAVARGASAAVLARAERVVVFCSALVVSLFILSLGPASAATAGATGPGAASTAPELGGQIPEVPVDVGTQPASTLFSFGFVDPLATADVTHRFVMRNVGVGQIVVNRAKVSCGCTHVRVGSTDVGKEGSVEPPVEIPEGGCTPITVSVDVAHVGPGLLRQAVCLYTAVEEIPVAQFSIQADVEALVSFRPSAVDFGRVPRGPGRRVDITVDIDPRVLRLVDLPAVRTSCPYVSVIRLARGAAGASGPTAPGHPTAISYRVELSPDAPAGTFEGSALFDSPGQRGEVPQAMRVAFAVASVKVRGVVYGSLSADPPSVIMPFVPQSTACTRTVRVLTSQTGGLRGLSLTASGDWFSARIRPPRVRPAKGISVCEECWVEVVLRRSASLGLHQGYVHLRAASGEQLALPVQAYVSAVGPG